MAYEEAREASLGRRCKAKAKAMAKAKFYDEEMSARIAAIRAREAAEELAAAQREAEDLLAWRTEAASQPDPWANMADIEDAVDSLPGSVVHADAEGAVSAPVSPGLGVPCTSCHAVHRGRCSPHDVLRAEIGQLTLYADQCLPRTEEFAELRDALYKVMAKAHGYLVDGGLTPERYADMLFLFRSAKKHHARCFPDA